jgi:cysteine-rich repeat protein
MKNPMTYSTKPFSRILLASVVATAALGAPAAHAATLTVTSLADDGSAGTLRTTITAAAAGDTIVFTPTGTITLTGGELLVDKNLVINATGITLQGAGAARVLRLGSGRTLQLSGSAAQPVRVRGGVAASGGGIDTAGTLTLQNAVISNNTATTGGGLYAGQTAGATTLTNVLVENNAARDGAGLANGTFAGGGSTMSLADCTVRNNVASGGGPFADNEGGGILNLATLAVSSSEISGNTAGVGGGIYSATMAGGTTLSLESTEISANSAKVAGGVFLLGDGTMTGASVVAGNSAAGGLPFGSGDGGGILNYGSLAIDGSEVSGNSAQRGGGIFSIDSLELQDTTVSGNTATDALETTAANRGGGIFSSGELLVSGESVIDDNTAGLGGGLFNEGIEAVATLDEASVSGNAAVSGAGIGNGDSQSGGLVTLTDCELSGNVATGGGVAGNDGNSGGAVLNYGRLEMTGGRVSGNLAGSGAGILNDRSEDRVCEGAPVVCDRDLDCTSGTGPCEDRGKATLTDVTIEDNRAGLGGGVVNRSHLELTGSTLARNRADYGGGIYNDGQGLLASVNSTLSDNLAGTKVEINASTQARTVVIDPDGGGNVFNNAAVLEMLNTTVHGGSISLRGGLFLIGNSILDDAPCSTNSVLASQGYNLASDDSCGLNGSGDAMNGVPDLDPLADNGGPTYTHALGSLSGALDTAHPAAPGSAGACATDDQRGLARTAASTGRCDKGAFESACGNGIVDASEACDDDNVVDGDGCDHNCSVTACGNGIRTSGEACDDGNLDSGDYCSGLQCIGGAHDGTACTADSECNTAAVSGRCSGLFCDQGAIGSLCSQNSDCNTPAIPGNCDGCGEVTHRCGDGSVEANEDCDDGDADNTDDCLATCRDAACGDGWLQDGVEDCDDANLQGGDGCSSQCEREFCGDGVVNNGTEACDDGNVDNNDGCRNDCALSSCGDGVPDLGEDCDDGNNTGGDSCSPTCLLEVCGNGILDVPEVCDDDNLTDGDDCDSNCTPTGCGNGVVTTPEVCDDGNEDGNDYCNADCTASTGSCGDGTVQGGVEGCDDGATLANGDGCDARCQLESCGDGLVNNGPPLGTGEACDDGNASTGDYCSSDCSAVTGACGDGDVQVNEDCDDSNLASGDGCDSTCREESCGDGIVNNGGEACDDGNNLSHDYCTADCSATNGRCGDGIVQSRMETCDDASQCADGTTDCTIAGAAACVGIGDGSCAPRSDDGCDANCRDTACGNGILTGTEECDDGNESSNDYCSPECESTGSCGDSIVQTSIENCDAGGVQTQTCEASCKRAICGDGVLNALAGEDCDDGRQCTDGTPCTSGAGACSGIGDGSCRTRGDDYCAADCKAATGSCGDGIIQTGEEECDDRGVQSAACELNCLRPRCGDSHVNALLGEVCDDGNVDSSDACTATCETAVCGDGFVHTGVEDCDDEGESILCDADCTLSTCGDGVLNFTAGESCDDGNVVDNDGCSSTCGGEGLQNDEQQRCILEMNADTLKLASAQARESFGCVKLGLKGVFDTINAQVCLTRDERQRVELSVAGLATTDAELCTVRPGFGYAGSAAAAAAAIGQNLGLVADLFGADLNQAIITKTASVEGHGCQTLVIKAANKMMLSRMKAFNRCKKQHLSDGSLDSAADLATVCFGEVATDTRRLDAGREKLGDIRGSRCEGVSLADAFPGSCSGLAGPTFDTCVDRNAACRMCLLLNAADRLYQPCDLFDDATANGSCQ